MPSQVVLITGGGRGIGAAIARGVAREGRVPVVVYHTRHHDAEALVGEIRRDGGHAVAVCADVGREDDILRCFEVADREGQLAGLVNNAGISQRSPAVDTDLSVYQRIVDVDLLAPIALTQALLSHMVSRGAGQIVMISSVAGKAGIPMRTAYCAAKHGLIGYADALRSEVAGQGVKVLVVAPGSVKTNVSRNALNADGSVRSVRFSWPVVSSRQSTQ